MSDNLNLEEILKIAHQITDWTRNDYSSSTVYDGHLSFGPFSKARVWARETLSAGNLNYDGEVYYKEKKVGELLGIDAKKIYEYAEKNLSPKELKRIEDEKKKKEAAKEKHLRIVEQVREKAKAGRVPWYRRLGE